MDFIGIIPAHKKSERFPEKALYKINKYSIIQNVYMSVSKSKLLSNLYVATDCLKIKKQIEDIKGKVILTKEKHSNGSLRCFEAYEKKGRNHDYLINIQGDQPFINYKIIDEMIKFTESNKPKILTTGFPLLEKEKKDENSVKTYVLNNTCINFSRQNICEENVFKHIGIYFFKDEIIDEIKNLKQTKREEKEKLEQLRWLQNNYKIHFKKSIYDVISVNSKEDLLDL